MPVFGESPQGCTLLRKDSKAFKIALTSLRILLFGKGSGISNPCQRLTRFVACYVTERFLTVDRLKKKGFQGPSCCHLCCDSEEDAQHIILDCNFSREIWQGLLSYWKTDFNLPISISDLFANWRNLYPGTLPKNENFKAAWLSLPKFVCWQIWLERSRRVFRDESLTSQFIIIKIKSLWKESLGEHLPDLNLSQQDLEWGASLDLRFSGDTRQLKDIKEWQFKGKENDLSGLLLRQSRCSLFFDGAAKGNPGLAGA
jgi:hypothetical protein